jgi:KDO2-lipid IV(A) lauroyltransferase
MRLATFVPGFKCAATYRGVRPPALDRLLYSLRTRGGGLLFERRSGAEGLKRAMSRGGLLLTLVSDQSTRDCGLELSFLGQNCFASRAPAVMAARYGCQLFVPICYRTRLGHWVVEIGEPIPTRENGRRRHTDDITRDVNRAFEVGVRRDPANWFWVHNRWKPRLDALPTAAGGEVQSPGDQGVASRRPREENQWPV